jgi:hypothetical protein
MIILLALLLTACQPNELSFDSVESARHQANENSESNAKSFRATHSEYSAWSIETSSDSTQSSKCGQGDGWATLRLIKIEGNEKRIIPLKCSTVSSALGCMSDVEFKTKSYAAQDGKCDTSLPFPLPKIDK